mgnify:CR=1 FL=1
MCLSLLCHNAWHLHVLLRGTLWVPQVPALPTFDLAGVSTRPPSPFTTPALQLSAPQVRTTGQSLSTPTGHSEAASSGEFGIVLSGIAKDINPYHVHAHIPKLIALGEALGRFHIVIYENDSNQESRRAFQHELAKTPHSTYLYEEGVAEGTRTQRIARARNTLMRHITRHFNQTHDFVLTTGMDGVCGGQNMSRSYDSEVFRRALHRSGEWDGIFFRFIPYWDLWAFRHPEFLPFNQFGRNGGLNTFRGADQVDEWLDTMPQDALISVDSAFMMLAVYNMSAVVGCKYDGVGVFGEMDCEHVAFHRDMVTLHNARLRLSPEVYCVGEQPVKDNVRSVGIMCVFRRLGLQRECNVVVWKVAMYIHNDAAAQMELHSTEMTTYSSEQLQEQKAHWQAKYDALVRSKTLEMMSSQVPLTLRMIRSSVLLFGFQKNAKDKDVGT